MGPVVGRGTPSRQYTDSKKVRRTKAKPRLTSEDQTGQSLRNMGLDGLEPEAAESVRSGTTPPHQQTNKTGRPRAEVTNPAEVASTFAPF